jgi:hypothetical protein
LDDGLSLEQIGAAVDRDPSTVGYWCKKFGLEPNGRTKHARRGGLARDELAPLVEQGMTHRAIAEAVDRSVPTVRYWLTEYGLEGPRRRGRADVEAALAAGRNTVIRQCRHHGETTYALVGTDKRPRCKKCRSEAVARKRRRIKEQLVEERGGKCALCGYRRCLGALHFHHVDPETKAFGIAHRGFTRSLAAARVEVEKCVVLCSNCHAEVEAGLASLTGKRSVRPEHPG